MDKTDHDVNCLTGPDAGRKGKTVKVTRTKQRGYSRREKRGLRELRDRRMRDISSACFLGTKSQLKY